MLKGFVDEGFFLFMAVYLTLLSIWLAYSGEEMNSGFTHLGGIICLGFSVVLGKLNDTNKK